ncbi:MAG: DUF499 domain-containing protein [Acidimicrobiaceae bacterium]|nr:DUF499 domain-containing protein [Acidimicrobiaceae bacterium]
MVVANTKRIAEALDLLRDGLRPPCERAWQGFYGHNWLQKVNGRLRTPDRDPSTGDVAFLLKGIKVTWNEVFGHGFPLGVRSLVFEVAEVRNSWAHQKSLSTDDAMRALDSMERLLEAFGNKRERSRIRDLRRDLMRQMFDEQSRSEHRRIAAKPTKGEPRAGLTPWREIITPHEDVAAGRFVQAEFAADLSVVADGDAEEEYQDPHAFYDRTYITRGLRDLLVGAARRLSGCGGDPIIELQTNFGGGKTHSMIALYHMASGVNISELAGIGDMLAAEKLELPTKINRAVLVGQMISPSQPARAEGGIRLHTLWGHLAYQLGGRAGYEMIRADDLAGTSPGAALKTLFKRFGPAVVLIDEWVAYARQLRDSTENRAERLAGGDFDTQFTFAQALTEAAAAASDVVVVISIPASDIEVGGSRGRTALERLKNVVVRKAAQWQPASPDESFEIVRRRLFDPLASDKARTRDGVIRAFSEMYRSGASDFPPETGEDEYRRRMELSYPIHPTLFDRLFGEWSTLEKFQRTRGVLRLMALAVSELWRREDRSLMIMPGNLPMDSGPLVSEMKKYLEDDWDPVIKSDVDGSNALPLRIDQQVRHFGRVSAARRAARVVYMGSAAHPEVNRGVNMKSVLLGCTQPGEHPQQFTDALRRLSNEATHLYVDGDRYWYSLQPNVTRMAADRATSHYSDFDADQEVRGRIAKQRNRGEFAAVQVFAEGPGDVPDNDDGVRLVVLKPDATHSLNDSNSAAVQLVGQILNQRDAGPRLNRNLVVFVAANANRLSELRGAARSYLAWRSIQGDREVLDLTQHQLRQAESKIEEIDKQVDSLTAETFRLVLVPHQEPGKWEITWRTITSVAAGGIAERISRKLASEEELITKYSGVRIRMDINRHDMWSERGDMAVEELWQRYARFPHMPRLANRGTLTAAISDGVANLDWQNETFAYADAHNNETWVGVHTCQHITPTPAGLIIRPDSLPAPTQPEVTTTTEPDAVPGVGAAGAVGTGGVVGAGGVAGIAAGPAGASPLVAGTAVTEDTKQPTKFYAQFNLDPVRCIKQLGEIADNINAHLSSHLDTEMELVLEVRAQNPSGFADNTQRTVSENATSLNAESSEFE